jgi:translation initiation factor IF-3
LYFFAILAASPSHVFSLFHFRKNEEIRAREVRLVTADSQDIVPLAEALRLAREQELDLIEIAPEAKPPVCKILDSGSFLYQLKKKEKQKSKAKRTEVKMIRFGFRTDKHDLDRQADRTREFLAERHLVKVAILMRGRELANQQYARDKLQKFVEGLKDAAKVEQEMRRQGNSYMMIVKAKK